MNEEQNTAAAGYHNGGGAGGGDIAAAGGGGGRNDKVGFQIFVLDIYNDRVELTVDKIYADLHTSRHRNDMKALIGLLLEGGFLSRATRPNNGNDNSNNNNNNDDDENDPNGRNNSPVVDIITLKEYRKMLAFISSNAVMNVPGVYELVEWGKAIFPHNAGRITTLRLKPVNCYGEEMISYRLGRSVGRLSHLIDLRLEGSRCASIPTELFTLNNLFFFSFCVDFRQGNERSFPPLHMNGLRYLKIFCHGSCTGLPEWLSKSKFPQMENLVLSTPPSINSSNFFSDTLAGISKSAGQRLRTIDINERNVSIGELLLNLLPKYLPNIKEVRCAWNVVLDLPAIAAKLQAADYHPDFEHTTAVNLRSLGLPLCIFKWTSCCHWYVFKNDEDKKAMVAILSHFKRVDNVGWRLDLKLRQHENDDTKRLNKKLEYLLKVNHSNGRVLIPGCNDVVLKKLGTQISYQQESDKDDKKDPPESTLPSSVWPKILESAWKKSKFGSAFSQDDPNATAVYTLLRPCVGSKNEFSGVGPCLDHLLNEADTIGQTKTRKRKRTC